jgi:dihydroorotate dehydrogenase electron transfer subunit
VTFVAANAGRFTAGVAANVDLSRRYFLLRLERPEAMPEPAAGQFVHLEVPRAYAEGRFFLRRPFSIFDATHDRLDLLIVELGPGTQAIRKLRPGDAVDFYGPLGGAFPALEARGIIAVGGGVGLAPLYFYGFREPGEKATGYRLVYGGRTREDLFLDHIHLEQTGVGLATDDGSYGFRGNAVELAERLLDQEPAEVMFSCGPTLMLRAAQRLASERGLRHFVSLENRMGCGLGACRACVVPTTGTNGSHYKTVCHDGPVFEASTLLWEELPTP